MKSTNFMKVIFFCFLLIPFFEPAYIAYNSGQIHKIFLLFQMINACIVCIIYLRKLKISKFMLLVIIYEFIIVTSTIINGAEIFSSIIEAIRLISVCFIVEYGLKSNTKAVVASLIIILLTLVSINFITILRYPDGMYINEISTMKNNWFLGNDNVHIRFFLPLIIISIIYNYITGQRSKLIVIVSIIICTISIFIRFSATTVVGYALLIIYLLLFRYIKNIKIINFKTYGIIYIISFFAIVIFRIQDMLSYIIVDTLGKSLTFTGRTYIWDNVIYYIKQKIFIGYGIESQKIRAKKNGYAADVHAHNKILKIFSAIFIYSLYKKKYYNNPMYKIISFAIFVFLIMSLTEAYNLTTIFILLVFANNIELLEKERNLNAENKK